MHDSFKFQPDEWQRLRALLDEALSLPPAERSAWVDALDEAAHAALKPRLRRLLAHAQDDGLAAPATVQRLLQTLPKVETDQFAPPPDGAAAPHEDIGPYRLIREIASGGMASVWLAERTDMLQRRQVALKLPHGAWRRAGLGERMAREREILATLEHPGVSRLYDAGVAADGQPYLALEYIDGERLDRWCERRALDVPARLRLFLQVARAVAYAHAQLVVHRDLKPSNILVTPDGQAKLLDFGIAKLLDQGLAEETQLTQQAGRAMTPDYAAPEQILGRPIGTAADVYALGVVLFELLAGRRPYQLKRDTRAALEEAILLAEVPRPSTVAPPDRRQALQGDLDTIVLKTLKRDPVDRYGTVAALADDIQRHLDRRPVMARPDSAWYRLSRFVHRNRWPVAAFSAISGALLAGAVAATWQARVAVAERERAEQVKTFIADLLRDANPAFHGGRKVTVDQLLLSTPAKIDTKFGNQPAVRAELLTIVATSLASIGEEKVAAPLLDDAVRAATQALGEEHALTLQARSLRVSQLRHTQPGPAVADEADRVIAAMRRNPAVDPAYLANLLLARSHMASNAGEHDAAIAFVEEALQVATQRIGESAEQTMGIATAVALTYQRKDDWRGSLEAARRVVRLVFDVRKLPDDHFNAVDARLMHGMALGDAGQLREGLAQLEAGVRHALVKRQPTDTTIGSYRVHLARYQLRAGQLTAAQQNLAEAMEIQRAAMGPRSRRFAAAAYELGGLHLAARRPAAAIGPLREAQSYFSGSNDSLAALVPARLAVALAATGQLAEAEAMLGGVQGSQGELLYRRGQVARLAGRPAEAIDLQQRALAALPDVPAQQTVRAEVLIERAQAERALGRPDAAATFERAIELLRDAQLQPTPALAEALVGAGRDR